MILTPANYGIPFFLPIFATEADVSEAAIMALISDMSDGDFARWVDAGMPDVLTFIYEWDAE